MSEAQETRRHIITVCLCLDPDREIRFRGRVVELAFPMEPGGRRPEEQILVALQGAHDGRVSCRYDLESGNYVVRRSASGIQPRAVQAMDADGAPVTHDPM